MLLSRFFIFAQVFIESLVSFLPFTLCVFVDCLVLMSFVRVWVSYVWVWFCEGYVCQFVASIGKMGSVQTLLSLRLVFAVFFTKMSNMMSYS